LQEPVLEDLSTSKNGLIRVSQNETLAVIVPRDEGSVVASDTLGSTESGTPETTLWRDRTTQSILLLNMVAILWGSQHAVIKGVIADSDPSAFTFLRFGLAALCASPYTPGLAQLWAKLTKGEDLDAIVSEESNPTNVSSTWRWGAEMGFWMFLGFSFQAIGLEFTTAQRSGFLLYLNVKFVPFLARILLGRAISNATWLSALTAFAGTALLAYGSNGNVLDLNVGDLWTIAAAVSSAMFILRLEKASSVVANSAALNAACLWVVTGLAGIWTFWEGNPFQATAAASVCFNPAAEVMSIALTHPWEIVYLSAVTTALVNWVQTKAQKDVSAERASVIYAMDPVYGAGFSAWLLGESLGGVAGWTGAGLITLAAATNAFLDFSSKDPKDGDDTDVDTSASNCDTTSAGMGKR
jgi:drug/metabolite transporter (DMT)-like permease